MYARVQVGAVGRDPAYPAGLRPYRAFDFARRSAFDDDIGGPVAMQPSGRRSKDGSRYGV